MRTSSDDMAAPLELRALTAGYNGDSVISDISLKLVSGEVHCMIGPNGAGKSTVIKAVTGEAQTISGAVFVNGMNVTGFAGERFARLGVGWVPQLRDSFSSLTVRENLEMGAYLLGRRAREERILEVVELFPLLQSRLNQRAGTLSGGERKVLALGRAIMTKPRILLLDEPTANLSPETSRIVMQECVRVLAAEGVAVLMVEQRTMDALAVSKWAYVMTGGTLRLSAPATDTASRSDLATLFLGGNEGDDASAVTVEKVHEKSRWPHIDTRLTGEVKRG